MKMLDKSWTSPLTGLTFAVVAVTGVAMLFELHLPAIRGLHEWVGLAFAIAGTIHLVLHWRTFIAYFRQAQALAILAIVLVACLALALASLGQPQQHGFGPPPDRGNPTEQTR